MAHLLDTHVWVWSQAAPERLGAETRRLLTQPEEPLYLATVSTLELARLVALGRIELKTGIAEWVSASVELLECRTVELSHEIALMAYGLPGELHRDPADRILVATARVQGLRLLTADERLLAYPHVESLDART